MRIPGAQDAVPRRSQDVRGQGENLRVMERILVDVKKALARLEEDATLLATASVR